jgi:hypothetical protein
MQHLTSMSQFTQPLSHSLTHLLLLHDVLCLGEARTARSQRLQVAQQLLPPAHHTTTARTDTLRHTYIHACIHTTNYTVRCGTVPLSHFSTHSDIHARTTTLALTHSLTHRPCSTSACTCRISSPSSVPPSLSHSLTPVSAASALREWNRPRARNRRSSSRVSARSPTSNSI